jgi:phospholipid transport system substrate-binding protein
MMVAPLSMRTFLPGLAAALTLIVLVTQPACAERPNAGAAAKFIQSLGDRAIATLQQDNLSLEQREQVFRRLLSDGFALELLGRFALGRHWRRATPEQRSDYAVLFSNYILKTYSKRLGGYAGETLAVTGTRDAGKQDVLVQTRISRPSGPPLEAGWRVRTINGTMKIIDIMVEGISMALTQRQEFAAVISQRGVDGLIIALRARADEMSATASLQ